MLNRRHFVISTIALAATDAFAKGLDPKDPDIKFGTTGSIFGVWPSAGTQTSISMKMSTNMPMMLADVKHYGLQGLRALFRPGSAVSSTIRWPSKNCWRRSACRSPALAICRASVPTAPAIPQHRPPLVQQSNIPGWAAKAEPS